MSNENHRKLPLCVYPQLVTDDIIGVIGKYDGKKVPEDIEELQEFTDKLNKLRNEIFKIHGNSMFLFSVLSQQLNGKAEDLGKSRYELLAEEMTVNDVFLTICYPFFNRWGGSFEARFALEGMLAKYLRMYKSKIDELH